MTDLFRRLHHRDSPLLLPNAWDYASAAALAADGFPAIGTTSLGVSAAAGLPDGAGAARTETVALARRLTVLPVPITVDIEAGFSADPDEVAALAAELEALGVSGVNIEDGRAGGTLADQTEQSRLIAAIKTRAPALFVNARIDTHWLGVDHHTTLDRAAAYRDAGADGIFVPGLRDPRDIARAVAAIPLPVNVLFLPDGPSVAALTDLGVRRISIGGLLFRAALAATVAAARAVRDGTPLPAGIPTYADVQALMPGGDPSWPGP